MQRTHTPRGTGTSYPTGYEKIARVKCDNTYKIRAIEYMKG